MEKPHTKLYYGVATNNKTLRSKYSFSITDDNDFLIKNNMAHELK